MQKNAGTVCVSVWDRHTCAIQSRSLKIQRAGCLMWPTSGRCGRGATIDGAECAATVVASWPCPRQLVVEGAPAHAAGAAAGALPLRDRFKPDAGAVRTDPLSPRPSATRRATRLASSACPCKQELPLWLPPQPLRVLVTAVRVAWCRSSCGAGEPRTRLLRGVLRGWGAAPLRRERLPRSR
jgi:hypothetical protein